MKKGNAIRFVVWYKDRHIGGKSHQEPRAEIGRNLFPKKGKKEPS